MKMFNKIQKIYHHMLILSVATICLSDSTFGIKPQPLTNKDNNGASVIGEVPPRIFPKDGFDDGILYKQSEVPPLIHKEVDDKSQITHSEQNSTVTSLNVNTSSSHKPDASTEKTMLVTKHTPMKDTASEVPDLLSSDNYNITVYEDGTDSPIENDTVTVKGPHVVNNSKTHEEEITKSSTQMKLSNKKNESIKEDTTLTQDLSVTSEPTSVNSSEPNHVENQTITSQEQTANFTLENNATVTEESTENGNETAVIKNEESTSEMASNVSVTQINTPIENSKQKNESLPENNKDAKVKTKSDNRTIKEETTLAHESVTSTTKEFTTSASTPTSTKHPADANTGTVQTTLKTETATSVNISENIIDHKADAPMALAALQHAEHSHASSGKSSAFLQPTESAAILAGVFVGIALLGYVGLLVWRRLLEKRYGNREMLVNEDDFYDTNDLRNFEL